MKTHSTAADLNSMYTVFQKCVFISQNQPDFMCFVCVSTKTFIMTELTMKTSTRLLFQENTVKD